MTREPTEAEGAFYQQLRQIVEASTLPVESLCYIIAQVLGMTVGFSKEDPTLLTQCVLKNIHAGNTMHLNQNINRQLADEGYQTRVEDGLLIWPLI